jgi:hypothetical protein
VRDDITAATAMLGLCGFRLLAASEYAGEFEQAVETVADEAFCGGCGRGRARMIGGRPGDRRSGPASPSTTPPVATWRRRWEFVGTHVLDLLVIAADTQTTENDGRCAWPGLGPCSVLPPSWSPLGSKLLIANGGARARKLKALTMAGCQKCGGGADAPVPGRGQPNPRRE